MKLQSKGWVIQGSACTSGTCFKAAHSRGWKLVPAVGLGRLASLHMGLSTGLLECPCAWRPAGPGFENHSPSLLPHLLGTQTNSRIVGGDTPGYDSQGAEISGGHLEGCLPFWKTLAGNCHLSGPQSSPLSNGVHVRIPELILAST